MRMLRCALRKHACCTCTAPEADVGDRQVDTRRSRTLHSAGEAPAIKGPGCTARGRKVAVRRGRAATAPGGDLCRFLPRCQGPGAHAAAWKPKAWHCWRERGYCGTQARARRPLRARAPHGLRRMAHRKAAGGIEARAAMAPCACHAAHLRACLGRRRAGLGRQDDTHCQGVVVGGWYEQPIACARHPAQGDLSPIPAARLRSAAGAAGDSRPHACVCCA